MPFSLYFSLLLCVSPHRPVPSTSLPIERRASRELAAAATIAPPKKDSEFRSVFNQMQLAQLRQSPSDLFAQHIVTIVHYIKGTVRRGELGAHRGHGRA